MNTVPRWMQGATLVVAVGAVAVIAVAVPTFSNQRRQQQAHEAGERGAKVYAAIAADARKAEDHDMAGQAYASALEKDPGNATYKRALAEVHAEQLLARPEVLNANNALRLQLELSAELSTASAPDAMLLAAYGKVLLFRDKDEPARERLRDAIKADPDLAVAHLFLGEALLRAKEPAQAQNALEKALSLKPGLPLAQWALGKAFAAREKWDDAAEQLTKAAEALNDAAVWLDLGRAETAREKWPEAERALSRTVALAPNLKPAWKLYAKALATNQKLAPAIGFYTRYYEQTGDLDAYNELGMIYLRAQQFERAVAVFRDLRRTWGQNPEVECRLGFAYESLKQLPPALGAFQRCARKAQGQEQYERTFTAANAKIEALNKLVGEQK